MVDMIGTYYLLNISPPSGRVSKMPKPHIGTITVILISEEIEGIGIVVIFYLYLKAKGFTILGLEVENGHSDTCPNDPF